MKKIDEYFANEYEKTEDDPHVVELVKKADSVLDIGCGHNQYKQYCDGYFWGIDPYNKKADEQVSLFDFTSHHNYDLIICFGVLHFYDIKWVDTGLKRVVNLLGDSGRIAMKVNPGVPNDDGSILNWFDRWTIHLINHYAEIYDLKVENYRVGTRGRIKWDYVK
jgi:CDGSH-type Zn-finger protein